MRRWGLVVAIACGCGGGGPTLTVVLAGTASEGSVTSPAGIDCGAKCNTDVDDGEVVSLAAVVPAGVVFTRWDGGGCAGAAADCMVTVTDDVTVTATFDQKLEPVDLPALPNHDLDLLIVDDDTLGTLAEQDNLKSHFAAFLDVLRDTPGGLPDLHIGVVSSDMGTLGVDIGDARCADSDRGNLIKGDPDLANQCPMISDSYIEAFAATANFTGPLTDAVSCLLSNGQTGCEFEAHLESMRAALDDNPQNVGFVRPTALLGVLILANEDDCSPTMPGFFGPETQELGPLQQFRCFEKGVRCAQGRDTDLRLEGPKTDCVADDASTYLEGIQHYVDFLRGLKTDPRGVIVGVVAGDRAPVQVGIVIPGGGDPYLDLDPSCEYTYVGSPADARPGIRLGAFADAFGTRGGSYSVCRDDLTAQLQDFGRVVRRAVGYPCLDGELYAPDACTLAYSTGTAIPRCTQALDNPPCWHVEVDATACNASPSHNHLIIEDTAPPLGAYVDGSCRVN